MNEDDEYCKTFGITGEQSSGIIKRNHSVTGDMGMLAGMVAMAEAATQNRPYGAKRYVRDKGPNGMSTGTVGKAYQADRKKKQKQSKASKRRNRR